MSSVEEANEITDFWYDFIENCIDEFKSTLKLSRTSDKTFELVKEDGNIKLDGSIIRPYVPKCYENGPGIAGYYFKPLRFKPFLPMLYQISGCEFFKIKEVPDDDYETQRKIKDEGYSYEGYTGNRKTYYYINEDLWGKVKRIYYPTFYRSKYATCPFYIYWSAVLSKKEGVPYDILKDPKLKTNPPEEFKQLNDLQPKHLTKVGSFYHIQNAWMQRFFTTCSKEMRPFIFTLYDFNDAGNEPFHSYSLNIYPSCSSKLRKYNMWRIREERWNEFKAFMAQDVKSSEIKSNHQGCYLLQRNCDEGSNKYKIGKSSNLLDRLKSAEYRNAFIYLAQFVQDEDACEREIIREFSSKFEVIKNDSTGSFGSETFAGDIKEMIKLFQEICNRFI